MRGVSGMREQCVQLVTPLQPGKTAQPTMISDVLPGNLDVQPMSGK